MKAMKKLMAIFASMVCLGSQAQTSVPKCYEGLDIRTFTYAVKGNDTLRLDTYIDPNFKTVGPRPVFIYSFGGGWESGTRKDGASDLIPFLTNLARQGFVGVGIDYRLNYLKARKTGKVPDISLTKLALEKKWDDKAIASAIKESIAIGVEDLYDATSYLIAHAKDLNIDTSKIVIGGGSAGANNSLTAEYWIVNDMPLARKHLPSGFNYAGIVNCAGDIWMDGKGDPQWKKKPCPMMFYHGEQDNIVPFDRLYLASVDGGLVGPKVIARQLKEMQVPYWLYVATDADHCMAGLPSMNNWLEMLSFMHRVVMKGEKVAIETHDTSYEGPRTVVGWIQQTMHVSKDAIMKALTK